METFHIIYFIPHYLWYSCKFNIFYFNPYYIFLLTAE